MKILEFPELRQTYNYDCGASALQSTLIYYGIEIREDSVMKMAKTTKEGTEIKNIIKVAKKYGLKADSRQMTIKDLKKFIDKKAPIIIPLQAWTNNKNIKWEDAWEDGHYVVLIGYDDKKFIFEDPSAFIRTYLTYKEFSKRWHDLDIDGKKYINHGIAIFGKKPKFKSKEIIKTG
ncbi:MAG: cysteine peptidase family C39 domain-containing protein [Patescibacteria group bacterium]|nr:cysteine peptidase family C39 domain-containing protein [Patescibacteria group bacterium]